MISAADATPSSDLVDDFVEGVDAIVGPRRRHRRR